MNLTIQNECLSSFGPNINVAIIGATGGIGNSFIKQFEKIPAIKKIWALGRNLSSFEDTKHYTDKCSWIKIDLDHEDTIDEASRHIEKLSTHLHLVLVTSGLLHDEKSLSPEKSWRSLKSSSFEKVFRANTFGPGLAAKYFLPLLANDRKSVFAALSARVGSISDNKIGGWHSYRASKAALNMLIKTFSIELAYRNPNGICIGLHPGTVDTRLSAPYTSNLEEGKLFTPTKSTKKMMCVLDKLDSSDTGQVYSWNGEKIPA